MELSENQKLQFIEASYHTVPDLELEKTDFVLNLMTQRFNDSKRSFLSLYTNGHTFDAMLIAGYMLELLAQMTKIRENRIEAKEICGKAAYKQIQIMLSVPEKENEIKWEKFFQLWISILEQYASCVFRKSEDVLSILKNGLLSRKEKLKQLNELQKSLKQKFFRHPIDIKKDIRCFCQHAREVLLFNRVPANDIEHTLDIMYELYCCHKHSNLLPLIQPSIDLAAFVITLSLVEYYDYFGKLGYLLKTYEVLSEC